MRCKEISAASLDLSNTQTRWLEKAADLSRKSTCRHHHGAVLVKAGRVIGVGYNRIINNPLLFPDDEFYDQIEHVSIHAEVDALQSAPAGSTRGAVLYVARTMPQGHWGLSKPCPRCRQAIAAAGVKRVIYTDNMGIVTPPPLRVEARMSELLAVA